MNTKTQRVIDKTAQPAEGAFMKTVLSAAMAAAIGLTGLSTGPAAAAPGDNFNKFTMVPSGAAKTCLPNAKGRVTVSSVGPVQNMHVEVTGLAPATDYALFVLQTPQKPFGLSWYQGDILTDEDGRGVADVTGIFSVETFILAPDVAPAPVVFKDNASSNPQTAPVQLYHLGVWFADPKDAAKAGCPDKLTPFDGDHIAGIQVLNTSNFANDQGPLRRLNTLE